jgi:hypothetical protein
MVTQLLKNIDVFGLASTTIANESGWHSESSVCTSRV